MALMRVGIDATSWWNRRGFGRFTREVVKGLLALPSGHSFVLFTDRPPDASMSSLGAEIIEVRGNRATAAAAVAGGRRRLGELLALGGAVARVRPDVMFFPAVWSWFPLLRPCPSVVTLHDAIAERFPQLVFPDRRGRLLWSVKVRLACLQASRLLTVSAAAKAEIVTHLRLAPARIDLTCEAADARFRPVADAPALLDLRRRLGLPPDAPVILYVGGIAPHKNLLRLALGMAEAVRDPALAGARLVLTGDPEGDGFHSNAAELQRAIAGRPELEGKVVFTGFLPDSDLPPLYSLATALVLPSVSEGFGLPAVEAMACGTPVLCGEDGAVREVAGPAAVTFPASDATAIGAAIRRIVTAPGLRANLAQKALQQAANYSWERAARLTLASLERAAGVA